jgi:hypothetical protein
VLCKHEVTGSIPVASTSAAGRHTASGRELEPGARPRAPRPLPFPLGEGGIYGHREEEASEVTEDGRRPCPPRDA